MADLTHLFKVGQHVKYKNEDFDAVNKFVPCIVKETYPDHIIITDTETNTDLWCEEGYNMEEDKFCLQQIRKLYYISGN